MDGGRDLGGRHGRLLLPAAFLASPLAAVRALTQPLGEGQVGGQRVVGVVERVAVVCRGGEGQRSLCVSFKVK